MSLTEKCKDCEDIEMAKRNHFCSIDCFYYIPLEGEGETKTIKKTRVRKVCSLCPNPADYRFAWLFDNFRSNPASSGFRKDDCTWCCDKETFSCEDHKKEVMRDIPRGCDPGPTIFPLNRFPHMGLEWKEEELKQ